MGKSTDNQMIIKRPKHLLSRMAKRVKGPLRTLCGASLVVLAGFAIWLGLSRSGYFTLQKIEVVGNLKQLTVAEVEEASQVKMGVNLFGFSLKEVEKNVLQLPWVGSVSVRRQVPQTLWIHVQEQKPVALLLSSKLYFISYEGKIFKEVEQELARDLPVLTGFKKEDSLEEALQLVHFFEGSSDFDLFGLSEIHYNDAEGFSVVTLSGPMEVKLGRGNFEGKLNRLKKIWPKLSQSLGRVHGIDLDYEDRAFVKL